VAVVGKSAEGGGQEYPCLYGLLNFPVPHLFSYFLQSLFTQYRTKEWKNRKTERKIFYARWKRRRGDKTAVKVHSRFQSLLGLMNAP
jgi:hypothetical protein